MATGSSGSARSTSAASTKAAARSRDYRRSARGYCLARMSPRAHRCCCVRRHCLPTADDHSKFGRAAKSNSGRFAPGDRPCCAGSFAQARCSAGSNRSLAGRGRGRWRCLALPKCGYCQDAARNCCPLRSLWTDWSCPWLRADDPVLVGAGARSFRNCPNLLPHCRVDSRTGRWFACCCARQSCQPGRLLLRQHRLLRSLLRNRCFALHRNVRRLSRRSSCAPIHAKQPVRELCVP